MSASPAELPAVAQTYDFPNCPPVPQEHIAMAEETNRREQHQLTRRQFGKAIGFIVAGAYVSSKVGGPIARGFTEQHWEDKPGTVRLVNERTPFKPSRRVSFVFPGFGQMDSYNAAHELYDQYNGTEEIAWIANPTRSFDANNMSNLVWNFIQKHQVAESVIYGESMGMVEGLMTFRSVHERMTSLIRQDRIPPHTTLPTPRMNAGNCSPADLEDAISADLAQNVAYIADKIGYSPDIVGKFMYDLFDGDGDFWRTLDVRDQKQFKDHLADSLQQALNETSPYTAWAQIINFLAPFNWVEQSRDYVPILNPDMDAVYVEPSGYDPIVNNASSSRKWQQGYANAGVTRFMKLNSGDSGHANTLRFAQVMAEQKFSGKILVDKVAA